MTNNDLINRINQNYANFSKGQRRLSLYIEKYYDRAVYLTAQKLGEEVGVSESTVVRFAVTLGYKGYPEFQKSLEEMAMSKLNSIQRMEVTYGKGTKSDAEVLESVLHSDSDKIKETLRDINTDSFVKAVDMLLSANKIYIIGIRSCEPLASFFSFYLNLILDNVVLINTNNPSEIFEKMIRIGEGDVIFGISFPRYSVRTLKALEFAKNRGADVISLTDSDNSPMAIYSSCNLLAKSDMASFVDSLVAPLSVVNALIVALSMRKDKEVKETLSLLENIWDEYQVYENDELEDDK
ncbi:MAG: MurR/RpiR family transcriptional regulator [Lachnospiraceae bacterium]|jgi:DNA-binding MurR/RpiR family transcriptional regulator|nr:MurR/RpiR family transcriptional regulator [Lachnospiraceae bacterium]